MRLVFSGQAAINALARASFHDCHVFSEPAALLSRHLACPDRQGLKKQLSYIYGYYKALSCQFQMHLRNEHRSEVIRYMKFAKRSGFKHPTFTEYEIKHQADKGTDQLVDNKRQKEKNVQHPNRQKEHRAIEHNKLNKADL